MMNGFKFKLYNLKYELYYRFCYKLYELITLYDLLYTHLIVENIAIFNQHLQMKACKIKMIQQTILLFFVCCKVFKFS